MGHTNGVLPLWFDGSPILGVERDPLGVEAVVRYQVRQGR